MNSGDSGSARFTNLFTTIATLAGVAIGLGNVWRFPYMMGAYGGGAFLIIYLVFMALVAIPALTAELALARAHRGGTITVMRNSYGPFGRVFGWLVVAGVLIASTYYTLVVGNVFFSAFFAITRGFSEAGIPNYAAALQSPLLGWLVAVGLVWLTIFVIDRGLIGGVERVSNVVVPFFFLIALYLVYAGLSAPGATKALGEFLKPDFSRIGAREIFAALGQCYFSTGLGASFAMIYGKFIREDTKLQTAAAGTAFSDVGASILASLFIVPAVLVFSFEMNSGPGLLFGTLPHLFAAMPAGRILASLLLVGLSLVAFLSVVAAFQVVHVSLLEERFGARLGRRPLLIAIGVVVTLLIGVPAFRPGLIGPMDLVFGSGFTIFGGFLAVVAVGWRMGRADLLRELGWSEALSPSRRALLVWLRFGIPVLLLAILGAALYDAFHG